MLRSIIEEMKRPATFVAVVITLISLTAGFYTSLYFYYKSIKEGHFYYRINQIKVFDQKQVSGSNIEKQPSTGINVIDKDGLLIKKNVYAAIIKIWNGGNDEIRRSDVREEFAIRITPEINPNFIGIDQTTNKNRDKFSISTNGVIDWQWFDQGDGLIVRIVYAADNEANIRIVGHANNASGPHDYDEISDTLNANRAYYGIVLSIIAAAVVGAYKTYVVVKTRRAAVPAARNPIFVDVLMVITYAFIALVLVVNAFSISHKLFYYYYASEFVIQ